MHKIYFNFFLLTFLALVARFAVCSGTEENRTDGTSPQTGDGMSEKSSLEKGMEPIFKLLHGFLDTVMPYNFYSQDDSPFSKYKKSNCYIFCFIYTCYTYLRGGITHVMKMIVILRCVNRE